MRCGLLLHTSHVAWFVCLVSWHTGCCAKTVEPIEMPFGGRGESCGSKEPCIRWGSRSQPRKERKGKEAYLYSTFYIICISQSAQALITQFYLQIRHACLSFVCVHQMAPPLTEVRDIQLQLTTHLSTQKG